MNENGEEWTWHKESQKKPRAATGLLISRCGEPQLEEPCNLGLGGGWSGVATGNQRFFGDGEKIEDAKWGGGKWGVVGGMGGLGRRIVRDG